MLVFEFTLQTAKRAPVKGEEPLRTLFGSYCFLNDVIIYADYMFEYRSKRCLTLIPETSVLSAVYYTVNAI